MNDKSRERSVAELEKVAKKIQYISPDEKTISKLSSLASQELYGNFDVPFVRGFSMLMRAVSSIKAKELNEE